MTATMGWLTLHEMLEATNLPYRTLMDLVERGLVATHASGAAVLYDPHDIALVIRAFAEPEALQ
jgi:hypothetical protein